MAIKWRALLAACVLGSALLVAFVWYPSTRGHLEGTVTFASCPGTAPVYQPGQPAFTCTSLPVPGAVVIAIPGTAVKDSAGRWTVVPSGAGSISVRTDTRGRYLLDLAPGAYMVGASESGWTVVDADGFRHQIAPAGSESRPVMVIRGATTHFEITISWNPA